MKDYIEERVLNVAYYIIENGTTVRDAAKRFGISKSTVHISHYSESKEPKTQR